MKKWLLVVSVFALLVTSAYAGDQFKTERDRIGYAIGMNIGLGFQKQHVDVDPAQVAAGLKAVLAGKDALLTEEEMAQTLKAFQQQLYQEMVQRNTQESKAFLEKNAKAEGVVTLESGLQYKVLASGEGKSPKENSTVQVHYRGTLIDGTEFDSSYSRGKPASFPVNGVIPGWTEALKLMKEGDKWQLAIPSQLAYGERGNQRIPPNSALIFDVELIKVD